MNMYVGSERNTLGTTKRDDNLPLGDIRPRGWDKIEAGHEDTWARIDAICAGQGKTATVKPTQPTKFSMLVGGEVVSLTCEEVERMLNMQRQTIEIMQFTQDNHHQTIAELRKVSAERTDLLVAAHNEINAKTKIVRAQLDRILALEGEKRTAQANASRKLKALQTQLDAKRAEFNALDRWSNIAADALDGVDAVIARAKGTLLA